MSSFLRRNRISSRFTFSQLLSRNRYPYKLSPLIQHTFCTSSTPTESITTPTDTTNAELMNQLRLMQKQLNQVSKQSKKSKWKYLFFALYFTPAAIIYFFVYSYWKMTRQQIIDQKNAYKVINIVTSAIHTASNSDISSLLSENNSPISFFKLKRCLDYAINDETVLGISLVMDNGMQIGYAQTQELREELKRFKSKNKSKFITSYGKSVDMKEYLLSTICDEFYLMEPAILNIYGFALPQLFFKNLLQKLGIKPYILKREKYKNFADMWTEDGLSKQHRESLVSLGSDLYSQFCNILYQKLAQNTTNYDMNDIKTIIDNAPYVTHEAIDRGLITNTMQWKDYQIRLSELGYKQIPNNEQNEPEEEEPDILFLSPKDYIKSYQFVEERKQTRSLWKLIYDKLKINNNNNNNNDISNKHVALINISGKIRNGESEGSNCGSDTIEELIRAASINEDVIAILLRIDSPGGDAIASESIWNTVYDAKENSNKPIVVSMGDICASGGYYIASAADKIFALPATITGSIGVVMMSLTVNKLLKDKLNINYDQSVKFGDNSDIMVPFEYPRQKLQERYETMIDSLYKIFMNRVAVGRDMTMEYVRDIAQGKVFTGQQALQIGLIDDLGGIAEAQLACEGLAGMDKGQHVKLVKYATKMEKLMDMLEDVGDSASASASTSMSSGYNDYIGMIIAQFNSFLKFRLWMNAFQHKVNDFQTISNEPKPYYLCLDF